VTGFEIDLVDELKRSMSMEGCAPREDGTRMRMEVRGKFNTINQL
jgi:hypothetical protein